MSDPLKEVAKAPEGKLAAEDTEEFAKIVGAIIKQWELKEPVDLMLANRMVSTWMKMRFVEGKLNHYGIYFEQTSPIDGSLQSLKVNELAYYLKQLEADFRAYYRVLSQKANIVPSSEETGFMEIIKVANKKNARSKKVG